MQMVEIRALKPFVGSYKCSLAEADMVDEQLAEKDGIVVKERVPRKRFIGLIPVQRALRPEEHAAWIKGDLPDHIEVTDDGKMCVEHPKVRTLTVPVHVASSLISRGLAEKVETVSEKKVKASAA